MITTATHHDLTLAPAIVLSQDDHSQLTLLALAGTGHTPDASDDLLYELDRAEVLPDNRVPYDAVRMGSTVRYRTGDGAERTATLAYPADADIGAGRISVLTPVGTALIGLRPGQSISWRTRTGRRQVLTVLAVTPPTDGEDHPGPMAA